MCLTRCKKIIVDLSRREEPRTDWLPCVEFRPLFGLIQDTHLSKTSNNHVCFGIILHGLAKGLSYSVSLFTSTRAVLVNAKDCQQSH
ncbi:hypothetical protein VFPPC_17541 [Pochonia chlamydosporia 170]|uniref:Uncharacterized protein n=1 Tax=Pochonia chlamydosporia 170 TaxID=1380566 RepID=A0A219ARA5_METCM|nr:hypothetical protein VFPPC_17541 [Pochonia chlamydosporia 170]OWT43296.1 hypothetical protein VFPPC_17541 [Pochonia chlamydosporia 170]